ncbi:MAG: hypothetical protein LBQ58_11265 [Synergistaceae bacterium]|jgi:hypothetical protein|nr:hypothetical protein [Synergistaceae bacterium]
MLKKSALKAVAVAALVGMLSIFASERAFAALGTDVVGQSAITSFSAMLELLPSPPVADEDEGVWVLSSPDGAASFWWRKSASESRAYDVYLCFDVEPFVNAGLNLDKLPMEMKMMLDDRGRLMIGSKLSNKPLEYKGEITPLSSFEQIVKLDREAVGYHSALDHYGVTVSEGSIFEWAKDTSKNDKDIVFVLNPSVFIDAGVDPAKVEGWVFAPVPVEDANGRKYEAEKFLKPFDLGKR